MVASGAALVSALPEQPVRALAGAPATKVAATTPRAGPSVPVEGGSKTAPAADQPAPGEVSVTKRWRTVLARLDRVRARAYAAADPGLLRSVYVPGSRALRRDRRLLAGYARRGLHVRGLRTDVEDLRVRAHRPGHVVLLVRDRVAAGTVAGSGHRRPLPADDLDSRLLTLQRPDRGVWLVAAVRPAPT